jgi:hypothetical protein
MARTRRNGSPGCGCLLGGLVAFSFLGGFAAGEIGLIALVMAAPAIVPFLLLKAPAEFHHDQAIWIVMLCAAPVTAFFLATARLPRRILGWLKVHADLDYSDPEDRRALRIRQYTQTLLLLAVTSAVGLAMLEHGDTATGPRAFAQTMHLAYAVFVPCVLLPILFRCWDHWSPPVGEAITVEVIRRAERDVTRKLSQVRAQNDAVREMTRQVERQLAAARQEVGFASLREQHHASFKCADVAYVSYESAKSSCRFITRIAVRARATATPRVVPLRDPRTGQRTRPQRAELRASATTLSAGSRVLAAETARGLQLVHTLNLRTGDLRDKIRDTCGPRGQRWYVDLIERREHARAVGA